MGFWRWYEKHYSFNVTLAAGLFVWQLVHLYWLSADVVASRLFGQSYFEISNLWRFLIALADYTEMPGIIAVSLFYFDGLRKKFNWKNVLFLIFLNSQWLHLFWLTDELIAARFSGQSFGAAQDGPFGVAQGQLIFLPPWLVWLAISIDYLELPVIYDIFRKSLFVLK